MAAQSSDHGLVTSPLPACSPRQRVLCTSCADDLKQKEKSGPPSDLTRTGNSISTYNILDRAVTAALHGHLPTWPWTNHRSTQPWPYRPTVWSCLIIDRSDDGLITCPRNHGLTTQPWPDRSSTWAWPDHLTIACLFTPRTPPARPLHFLR